jgi:hypothetical protein
MSKTNNFVFIFLQIIAWIFFVGLSIEAGGYLVNFFFSLFRPDFVPNLYQKLDLSELFQKSQSAFFGVYGFLLIIVLLKPFLFYRLIQMMFRLNLTKPFNENISKQICFISYVTLAIGFLSIIAQKIVLGLEEHGFPVGELKELWTDGEAYILMGVVVYFIAMIFKKGVEIQTENDLTV